MIGPLVIDREDRYLDVMGDAVLGNNDKIQRGREFINGMADLGIDVIGSAGENHNTFVLLSRDRKRSCSLVINPLHMQTVFGKAFLYRVFYI